MTQTTPLDPLPVVPDLPLALRPTYTLGGLNCPITLYEGELELEQGTNRLSGPGRIAFEWLPSPRITFELSASTPDFFDLRQEAVLRLTDGRVISDAHFTRASQAFQDGRFTQSRPTGRIRRPPTQSSVPRFAFMSFLVPNFPEVIGEPVRFPTGRSWAARIPLSACGWTLTLDPVDHPSELRSELAEQAGYLVTHEGRLEREDHSSFTEDEADQVIRGLNWYLSFAAGRWTGPMLARGHDESGASVRGLWNITRIGPWRTVFKWMDDCHLDHLTQSFPGYMQRWTDANWNEMIELAVHWYVEANAQAGSVEGALVLTQAAFEMLAAVMVVDENGWVSADAFEKLPAADRIRLLFVWADIPLAIPATQSDLTALARGRNWTDAPQALTEIRNPLAHPTPKNRQRFRKYPPEARTQAWVTGLWFLELCVLRLCGYNGTYGSRLGWRSAGEVTPVPWASGSSTSTHAP